MAVFWILALMLLSSLWQEAQADPVWQIVNIPDLPTGASLGNAGDGVWTGKRGEVYVWANRSRVDSHIPESWLYKTSDGGTTWNVVLSLPDSSGLHVWGTGPNDVFAGALRCPSGWTANCGAGRGPQIFRSVDGGATWVQQTLPVTSPPMDGWLNHFAGAPNDVYFTGRTWGSLYNERVLRFNGTSWSVVLTDTSAVFPQRGDDYAPNLVYIGPNEIYGSTCWGHWLWNGSVWSYSFQFDFCDAGASWGMRDNQGVLHMYAIGNNNFSNGVKIWRCTESTPGNLQCSWGSKYGYVFSDGNCGSGYQVWGSGPQDVWATGNFYFAGAYCGSTPQNVGRIYHFDGITWVHVITPFDPLQSPVSALWGTAPDDIWVANNTRLLHLGITNNPPVAKCKDITVVAGPSCTAIASIDNGSYDPDDGEITLTQDPAGPYGLGTTLVTLTVSDDEGATSQCTGTVTVVDNTPPTITNVSARPSVLWPPNHKMVPVTVSVSAYDNCDPNPYCKITSVSSNEPENGLGDGDTAPDWEITGDLTVNLRAERSGKGDGRIYTITITCTDDSGNSSTGTVNVTVPHDQKKK